jgi:Flp pilus assembly protein TadD
VIRRRPFAGRRLDRWLRGETSLGRLLRLKDRDRDDLASQAYRRVEAEQFDAALRLFELLGRLWPESGTSARLGQGVCAQRLGDFTEAERAYDEVLGAEPRNPYARANRAEVRLLTGRREAARADLAAIEAGETPKALRDRIAKLLELSSGNEPPEPAAGP